MKKELIYYSILALIIAPLIFIETNIFSDNTKNLSKVLEVAPFEKLDIDLECNIYISLGDEQKVVFEGPKNFLNRLETRIENGVLKISCKEPGLFAELFGMNDSDPESLNLYIKITDANQLISPKKGNLISNETSLFLKLDKVKILSFNNDLRNLLKLIGNSLGCIRIL